MIKTEGSWLVHTAFESNRRFKLEECSKIKTVMIKNRFLINGNYIVDSIDHLNPAEIITIDVRTEVVFEHTKVYKE